MLEHTCKCIMKEGFLLILFEVACKYIYMHDINICFLSPLFNVVANKTVVLGRKKLGRGTRE